MYIFQLCTMNEISTCCKHELNKEEKDVEEEKKEEKGEPGEIGMI